MNPCDFCGLGCLNDISPLTARRHCGSTWCGERHKELLDRMIEGRKFAAKMKMVPIPTDDDRSAPMAKKHQFTSLEFRMRDTNGKEYNFRVVDQASVNKIMSSAAIVGDFLMSCVFVAGGELTVKATTH